MPSNIIRQTMAWASGLANYIPPIALTLLYLVIVKNIFDKDKPKYNNLLIPVSFVVGVCGNLFYGARNYNECCCFNRRYCLFLY